MMCCGNCFGDANLRWYIEELSDRQGICDFCNNQNIPLAEPADLRAKFEHVIGAYQTETSPEACDIQTLLRRDWNLFQVLDRRKARSLIKSIFGNSEALKQKFIPMFSQRSEAIEKWEAFRKELKHENRYFPKNIPDNQQLSELFYYVSSSGDLKNKNVFRARISEEDKPYCLEEMGKPAESDTVHGRANPFGIPYLYVASDMRTAISEVRPHVGDSVCVATFKVVRNLKLVDLRDPRKTISPFAAYTGDQIKMLCHNIGYLCRLGEELSIPVLPREAHLEYLPSQYLCEYIKHCDYDGVIYKSATSDGTNYAVFNDSKLKAIKVDTYSIDHIDLNFSKS
jgi:hypothetical protein